MIYYDTPFYDVMRINPDTDEEHFIVKNHRMSGDSILDYAEEINSEIADDNTTDN